VAASAHQVGLSGTPEIVVGYQPVEYQA